MIISQMQHSTSKGKNWLQAHQSSFLIQTVYQRRITDNNRTCLIFSTLQVHDVAPSWEVKSFLHLNRSVISSSPFWTWQIMAPSNCFFTFFMSTSRVPPKKILPKPQATDYKITICFISFANSSNIHFLHSHIFKVHALHTKHHSFFKYCPKGSWYCFVMTSIFLSRSYRN